MSIGPGPGHVPPRLVTDVERLYVTRRVNLSVRFARPNAALARPLRRPGLATLEAGGVHRPGL